MTTPAPSEATLDRIERMTPRQIAQEYTGRAIVARAAAVTHLNAIRAESQRSGDYAASHALVTADAYTRRAETYAREAITAANYGATFESMTDEARAQLHTAANLANAASAYADAVRAIAQSVKLAAKARTFGDITQ